MLGRTNQTKQLLAGPGERDLFLGAIGSIAGAAASEGTGAEAATTGTPASETLASASPASEAPASPPPACGAHGRDVDPGPSATRLATDGLAPPPTRVRRRAAHRRKTHRWVARVVGWTIAAELGIVWVALFRRDTLPWLVVPVAGAAVIVLAGALWGAAANGNGRHLKH